MGSGFNLSRVQISTIAITTVVATLVNFTLLRTCFKLRRYTFCKFGKYH